MPISGGLPGSLPLNWVPSAAADLWNASHGSSDLSDETDAVSDFFPILDPLGIYGGGRDVSPFEKQSIPINSPAALDSADSEIPDDVKAEYDIYGDWFSQLFETQERAAVEQARRNESSAFAAWRRSELAADAALRRARDLRKTQYQDAVESLKAAGLNPVLAAGNGISSSSSVAPQATAPASSSSSAGGINGADLLLALASILTGSGNLMKGISSFLPTNIISNVTSKITGNYSNVSESTNWNYNYRR